MAKNKTVFSVLWTNPRCWNGHTSTAIGVLFLYLGSEKWLRDPANEFALWTIYVGGLLFLVGATLTWVTLRREIRTRALTAAAPASRGRVLSVKKDWLSQAYVLHYRFNDSRGRPRDGKKILPQLEAFTWREGEEGEVRYDPKDPKTSKWIGRGVEFPAEGDSATAPATVIEVTPRNADGGKETFIGYRYRDHLGKTHEHQFIENEGKPYKVGEAGIVEFNFRHPGLSAWVGKTDGVTASGDITEARLPVQRVAVPLLGPASRPSTFRLAGRAKPLKNARLLLFYIFIVALFLLLMVAVAEAPASRDDKVGLTLFSVLLFALAVWFALSVWKGVRQVKDWRRIADLGLAAEGTVNLVEEKRQNLGRWTWKPRWVISYRYHDHEGKPHTGESGYLSPRAADRWRSGDKCVVLYDPTHPSKSVWIGKA